jgi:hypothetical protein
MAGFSLITREIRTSSAPRVRHVMSGCWLWTVKIEDEKDWLISPGIRLPVLFALPSSHQGEMGNTGRVVIVTLTLEIPHRDAVIVN